MRTTAKSFNQILMAKLSATKTLYYLVQTKPNFRNYILWEQKLLRGKCVYGDCTYNCCLSICGEIGDEAKVKPTNLTSQNGAIKSQCEYVIKSGHLQARHVRASHIQVNIQSLIYFNSCRIMVSHTSKYYNNNIYTYYMLAQGQVCIRDKIIKFPGKIGDSLTSTKQHRRYLHTRRCS